MNDRLNVLVIDDSEDDCFLSLRELQSAGFELDWKRVQDERELRAALAERTWHVALIDYCMPTFDGTRAIALLRELAPDVIRIVVSGSIGEDRAVECIRLGASDYVLKDRLRRLPLALTRELSLTSERLAREQAELNLREMSRSDLATGLPNRSVLEERMSARLACAPGACERFAVVVIEIERLAAVRQAFGHSVVDDLVRQVGRRLADAQPPHSTLTSLGTHEFGLLLPAADAIAAEKLCEEMRRRLEPPIVVGAVPIQVEATMGVAQHPGHGDHPSLLLRHACEAVHSARSSGLAACVYRSNASVRTSQELVLLGELRGAIDTGQLTLEYQPVLDLCSNQIVSVEALVRWDHPSLGRIMPGGFMPQVESCALIHPLTRAIVRAAAEWNANVRREGWDVCVAVNFAARNLIDPAIVGIVEDTLSKHGLPAERLEIEITEGALMADPKQARAILERLRALGTRLLIDDFGTGYSSFSYLRDLPVHGLKIDRSFVARMACSSCDAAIVQGIVELGHTLGLSIVAEGVEDELTLDLLSAFECDRAQGYWIGRPMSASALMVWRDARTLRTAASS